jgi:hypothetical protein
MRGKIAKLIRKEVYRDRIPNSFKKYFVHNETGQTIRDEKRRQYQKTKDVYHKTKIRLTQKESTKTLEKARIFIKRRERNRQRFLERQMQKEAVSN